MFILYSIPHHVLDHPQIKYFPKSLKSNRSLVVCTKNIIDIPTLKHMINCCEQVSNSKTFKTLFLTCFFICLGYQILHHVQLVTLTLLAISLEMTSFWQTFSKTVTKIVKNSQTRDRVTIITIPKPKDLSICPHRALKVIINLHKPSSMEPSWDSLSKLF